MADKLWLHVAEQFSAVRHVGTKSLRIICNNISVSMPDTVFVACELSGHDFIAVSDMFTTAPSARMANMVLSDPGQS